MKGLKPVKQNTDSTLIASSVAAELQAAIANVNSQITAINSELEDINAALNTTVCQKNKGQFNELKAFNASVDNRLDAVEIHSGSEETEHLTTPRVDAGLVSADDISSDNVSTHTLNADGINVSGAVSFPGGVTTPTVHATDINATNVDFDNMSVDEINTPAATVGTLTVDNLRNLNDFETDILTARQAVNTPRLTANKTVVSDLEANLAKMDKLFTNNIAFNSDETDPQQYVEIDPYQSGVPSYIEIPAVSSGYYRINVRKQNGQYWAVTIINTETCPVIQYNKADETDDLDMIYYDGLTNKTYVKTYSDGKIFWANNDKHGTNGIPKVYQELPIDDTVRTTYHYRTLGQNRVVIMGDNSIDFGFAIQGVLEADVIKEKTAYHQLFFYGSSYDALKNFADKYMCYIDENEVKHYTTSQATGYIWHKDDPNYRDSDGNECEAVDKVSFDGTKFVICVNNQQGKDEIVIDDSVGTEFRFNENGLPPLSDVEHFIESLAGHSIEVINNMSTEIRVEKGKTILYITHNDLVYPGRTVYIINEIGSGVGRAVIYLNDGSHHIIYDTFINGNFINTGLTVDGDLIQSPSELLPFDLSFTLSSIAWDQQMNQDVYNSYSIDRS
jgi:hypothetical protein